MPIRERYDWRGIFAWLEETYGTAFDEVDIFVFDSEGLTDDEERLAELYDADRKTLTVATALEEFLGYLPGTADPQRNNRNRTLCFWLPGSVEAIHAATRSVDHRHAERQSGAYQNRWPVRWRITNGDTIVFTELNRDWEPVPIEH